MTYFIASHQAVAAVIRHIRRACGSAAQYLISKPAGEQRILERWPEDHLQ
jgi:hypothetical protein